MCWYLSEDRAVARAGRSPSGIATGRWIPPLAFLPLDARHHPVLLSLPRIITGFSLPPASTNLIADPLLAFPHRGTRFAVCVMPVPQPREWRKNRKETALWRLTQVVIPHVWEGDPNAGRPHYAKYPPWRSLVSTHRNELRTPLCGQLGFTTPSVGWPGISCIHLMALYSVPGFAVPCLSFNPEGHLSAGVRPVLSA